MPDFFMVDAPLLSPTHCIFCLSSSDIEGFLDGGKEVIGHGHLWICATCAKQAGDRVGMLSREDAGGLLVKLTEAQAKCEALELALADALDRVLVSGSELRKFIDGDRKKKAAA